MMRDPAHSFHRNAVRRELKANGTVASEEQNLRVLVQRQDMTGAERSWASRYEINDVIRYARGSKSTGIESGEYGKVVGINSAANLLTVERSLGELANYDPRRLTGVSVYREVARDFPSAPVSSSQLRIGRWALQIAISPLYGPDGQITACLDNNRRTQFNAAERRHFDYGYALTSHSAQGSPRSAY
jgi:hypothetical protein